MNNEQSFRQYPKLPQLTMEQSMLIFKKANVTAGVISKFTGVSRVIAKKWLDGAAAKAQRTSVESVSTLAYKVLRALVHGHFPIKATRNPPASELVALHDSHYAKALSEYTAQELLPPSWLEQFNLPREQDAAERIL